MKKENINIPLEKDRNIENIMGSLLRTGVVAAAVIVAFGAFLYLTKYGFAIPQYSAFKGEPEALKSIGGIIKEAFSFNSRGIMQLGLLVLIATPVARVIFAIIGFAAEKDYTYTVISAIVLGILLFSLFT
ncbi:MAG: DUF1634 domain-containing protein [Ignavibacteria bacterium]|jgi:uncharacterized membrane protein|nr:DUF1634 domain-containing protein [Ignavibacteria bacterium]